MVRGFMCLVIDPVSPTCKACVLGFEAAPGIILGWDIGPYLVVLGRAGWGEPDGLSGVEQGQTRVSLAPGSRLAF